MNSMIEQFVSGFLNDSDKEKLIYAVSKKGKDKDEMLANVEVIEFDSSTMSSKKTSGEIKSLIETGKAFVCVMNIADGVRSQFNISYTSFSDEGNEMIVYGLNGRSSELKTITFYAATDNDVFTASGS